MSAKRDTIVISDELHARAYDVLLRLGANVREDMNQRELFAEFERLHIPLGRDTTVAELREWVEKQERLLASPLHRAATQILQMLRESPRGEEKDEPEGVRYVRWSETLVRETEQMLVEALGAASRRASPARVALRPSASRHRCCHGSVSDAMGHSATPDERRHTMASEIPDLTNPSTDAEELLRDGAFSVDDAVAHSALSRAELYRRMGRGQLPYVVTGRRRLIPKRALAAMLARGLRGGADPRSAA